MLFVTASHNLITQMKNQDWGEFLLKRCIYVYVYLCLCPCAISINIHSLYAGVLCINQFLVKLLTTCLLYYVCTTSRFSGYRLVSFHGLVFLWYGQVGADSGNGQWKEKKNQHYFISREKKSQHYFVNVQASISWSSSQRRRNIKQQATFDTQVHVLQKVVASKAAVNPHLNL